jgi:hypothetical protein
MGRARSTKGGRGMHIGILGKPTERRPLGRPILRWVDNIKMNLNEIRWVVWTGLIWLRIGASGELFRLREMLGNS